MGDHRFNPVARAAAQGKQVVRALDIGEGFALLGTQLLPVLQGEELVIFLTVIGGKDSPVVGLEPRPVVVREIARVPLANVRRALAGGEEGSDGEGAGALTQPPTTESAEPDVSPPLILGGPLRAMP